MPVLDKNNKEEVEKYSEFVRNKEGASLTQDLNWAMMKEEWKQEAIYLEKEGEIIASMMILIKDLPIKGYTMMYAPRGPVCDASNISLVSELVKEAEPLAKKYNAAFLKWDPQILSNPEIKQEYKKAGFAVTKDNPDQDVLIQPLNEAVLSIANVAEEDLMKRFSEKTRYNIRLSKRKGVNVYYSREMKDLEIFYKIYQITTIRDHIGCRDFSYFEKMLQAYDESQLRIYIAEHEGDALSAAIAINYGKELFYLYGASSNEKRNLMPNYAMQWEMIRWGLETGCRTYNFGGVLNLNKEDGLYKFKTGFCKAEGIVTYIGEIDKIYKKTIYQLYTKVLPVYKKVKRKTRKNKNQDENKSSN